MFLKMWGRGINSEKCFKDLSRSEDWVNIIEFDYEGLWVVVKRVVLGLVLDFGWERFLDKLRM